LYMEVQDSIRVYNSQNRKFSLVCLIALAFLNIHLYNLWYEPAL